ncbi:yjeF N-terminal domain-containing protein 3 [Cynocephalus volans]|uniref:yjeF N-terminal domain-containing protein 3 n=1 Tax=Cynocephalus volans TaxID=110931 RepID=UPI002FCC8622
MAALSAFAAPSDWRARGAAGALRALSHLSHKRRGPGGDAPGSGIFSGQPGAGRGRVGVLVTGAEAGRGGGLEAGVRSGAARAPRSSRVSLATPSPPPRTPPELRCPGDRGVDTVQLLADVQIQPGGECSKSWSCDFTSCGGLICQLRGVMGLHDAGEAPPTLWGDATNIHRHGHPRPPEGARTSGFAQNARCQMMCSTAEAAALEWKLLEDYRFGRQQLVELCGHASAVAVPKVFPLPALSWKQRTVLVVCGPEQNGAVGLVCARHLQVFEYEPTIFYPTCSLDLLHWDLTTQCKKMDISFLSYLPSEVQLINDAYGLVVDSILGPGVEPNEVRGPCTRALATVKLLSIPLVSLDIPLRHFPGWDAETGGHAEDGLRPDVLVSLVAPKRCAGRFSGRHHFVAGRFVPNDVHPKFALPLPGYTGTDCVTAL